jgi:hypothetical protein
VSAYDPLPAFTNFVSGFQETLDYILATPGRLAVTQGMSAHERERQRQRQRDRERQRRRMVFSSSHGCASLATDGTQRGRRVHWTAISDCPFRPHADSGRYQGRSPRDIGEPSNGQRTSRCPSLTVISVTTKRRSAGDQCAICIAKLATSASRAARLCPGVDASETWNCRSS